jgi:hypothetical protein
MLVASTAMHWGAACPEARVIRVLPPVVAVCVAVTVLVKSVEAVEDDVFVAVCVAVPIGPAVAVSVAVLLALVEADPVAVIVRV